MQADTAAAVFSVVERFVAPDLIKAVNSALASKNASTMMSLANTLNKWNNGYCP